MRGLAWLAPPGCFVEVGVYKGGSARVLYHVAQRQQRRLYLYDTFAGIPYAGQDDPHKVGDFIDGATPSELQEMMPQAIITKGVFPCALPKELIAFVHLDCDQYQSYRDALVALVPRLANSGLILCDDYVLPGAHCAIHEAVDAGLVTIEQFDHRVVLRRPA